MPLALLKLLQEFGEDFGLGYDQDVVHDLANFHVGNARRYRLHRIGGITQAGPTHQVLGVKHSDDVFRATLRIIDRNTRVLLFDHPSQGFLQGEVAGEGEDIGAGHHDFAHRNVFQFQGLVNHFLLEGRNLTELAAGRGNQVELIWRMDGTLPNLARTEYTQHDAGGAGHHKKEGAADGEENVHGSSDYQGDLFGTLQSQGFRNQCPEDHVQTADQSARNCDGDSVGISHGMWNAADRTLDHAGQQRLAHPA